MTLPFASSKRSRLSEVLGVCSAVSRRLSLRERAIIREMNEIVFALSFLETDGIVGIWSWVRVGYSIFFTELVSLAMRRLLMNLLRNR